MVPLFIRKKRVCCMGSSSEGKESGDLIHVWGEDEKSNTRITTLPHKDLLFIFLWISLADFLGWNTAWAGRRGWYRCWCCGSNLRRGRTLRHGGTARLGICGSYALVSLSLCPSPSISKGRHSLSKNVWATNYGKGPYESHTVNDRATWNRRLDCAVCIQTKGTVMIYRWDGIGIIVEYHVRIVCRI